MASQTTLTRAEFKKECTAFISKERAVSLSNDLTVRGMTGWKWHQHPNLPDVGYMARVGEAVRYSITEPSETISALEDNHMEEAADVATLVQHLSPSSVRDVLVVQQHVVYSPTFQVPSFYFTVHDKAGGHLSLQDIMDTSLFRKEVLPEEVVATAYGISTPHSNFPLLSQGDHPVLGSPFWFLHPCATAHTVLELIHAREAIDETTWLETWFLILCGIVNL